MNEDVFGVITAAISAMAELLREYTQYGERLLTCGTDEEINEIIAARFNIIEKIKENRALLDNAAAKCDKDEADIIDKLLKNKTYRGAMSEQLTALCEQISTLRSLQLGAIEKDKLAQTRLTARFEDIKLKLEELQDEKKKIDFYSKSSGGGYVGGSLDSHS